jgi:two-component system C4-dicarboxylate transport sensor histidine kinase DctB
MEYRVQLETRLAHVERIATLGTMLATVAHEVATPLTLINANTAILAGALRAAGSLDASRQDISSAASEIRVAAGLIQTIVQRIRMFSRRDERRRVTAPLVQVADTALLLIKPLLLGRSISIAPPQGQSPIVPHYPIRLTQALINILTNAVEAIGHGREGRITLRWLDDPDDAGIAVDDDGPGLSDQARSRVFEPFFTSKAEGTGLGLVLVRAIMREHDGSFELRPAPSGQGASARLLLPKAVEDRPTSP